MTSTSHTSLEVLHVYLPGSVTDDPEAVIRELLKSRADIELPLTKHFIDSLEKKSDVSTVIMIDDYFLRHSLMTEDDPEAGKDSWDLRPFATNDEGARHNLTLGEVGEIAVDTCAAHGISVDFLALESACAPTGDGGLDDTNEIEKAFGEPSGDGLVESGWLRLPPPSTNNGPSWLLPDHLAILDNDTMTTRSTSERSRPAHWFATEPGGRLPSDSDLSLGRQSISLEVELWDCDSCAPRYARGSRDGTAGGIDIGPVRQTVCGVPGCVAARLHKPRRWACPSLAAWWQLKRLGATGESTPLPALREVSGASIPFIANTTISVLDPEFLRVEHSVRNIVRFLCARNGWDPVENRIGYLLIPS